MNDDPSASAAIRTLYELYAQDIYRYAWFNLGNGSQAEDVMQEVYLRALRSWSSFRNKSGAKTWLIKIARNYIYDLYRKKETERKFLEEYDLSIQDDVEAQGDILQLQVALSEMKETYRQVIILRYIQMFSTKETGIILGWTEAKVRSIASRAMRQLRKILGPEHEEVSEHEVGKVNSGVTEISQQTPHDVRK